MWFLWCFLTFLVVIFSTSQLIAYVISFIRYPYMMEGMHKKDVQCIVGGLILHSVITIVWTVTVCVISSIRQHWIAIITTVVIGIILSIIGIRTDDKLKHNFGEVTGYNRRHEIERKLSSLIGMLKSKIKPLEELEDSKSDKDGLSLEDISMMDLLDDEEQEEELLEEQEDEGLSFDDFEELDD